MQVIQTDYTTQVLKLHLPGDPRHRGKLTSRVTVTQPSGYALEIDGDLQTEGKRAEVRVRYPLMDDGAWEQIEGPGSSLVYEMGVTTFEVAILSEGSPIVTETCELDQDTFYANSGKGRLRHDFPPGFIECAPLRPVCIDHDENPAHDPAQDRAYGRLQSPHRCDGTKGVGIPREASRPGPDRGDSDHHVQSRRLGSRRVLDSASSSWKKVGRLGPFHGPQVLERGHRTRCQARAAPPSGRIFTVHGR